MIRVLFVCTANISRSPYAQVRMSEIFGDQVVVASAGIPGTEGREMDPAMEAELPFDDEEAQAHRSRVLTREILVDSDVVLTMEFFHHMRIVEEWPEEASRVFGLRQFVDALAALTAVGSGSQMDRIAQVRATAPSNSMMWDIEDPYRRGSRAARRCADELDQLVLALGRGLGLEPDPEAL